ncbi:hypothetical protein KR51_00010970 [Rubidibacter lacunae KORDI 51-2]|uniref:Uncharacterized protein n=1 Tax=Rubidibacter lacunae KORDI 51-2 TaxID=582515 RepID=U5DCA9_9CHRO|nr:hypothetical protein KR51_00010970 [Rubidibacter lacunae KORDI 51-2]
MAGYVGSTADMLLPFCRTSVLSELIEVHYIYDEDTPGGGRTPMLVTIGWGLRVGRGSLEHDESTKMQAQ